eukprot:6214079-Pleurochrysis_carterae.AAC.3
MFQAEKRGEHRLCEYVGSLILERESICLETKKQLRLPSKAHIRPQKRKTRSLARTPELPSRRNLNGLSLRGASDLSAHTHTHASVRERECENRSERVRPIASQQSITLKTAAARTRSTKAPELSGPLRAALEARRVQALTPTGYIPHPPKR